MLHKNRLFTPGPTPLLPAAQTAMASYTAHHRTADFKALFQRVLGDMKEFVGTKNDVLVLACSGSAGPGWPRLSAAMWKWWRLLMARHSRSTRCGRGFMARCGLCSYRGPRVRPGRGTT